MHLENERCSPNGKENNDMLAVLTVSAALLSFNPLGVHAAPAHHHHHKPHHHHRTHRGDLRWARKHRHHHRSVSASSGGGEVVGASEYGGEGSGSCGPLHGYAFAELGMGHFLGTLPCGAKLWITYNGRTIEGEKQDIGEGGDSVEGHTRAIDLYETTARALNFNGLGLVTVRPAW